MNEILITSFFEDNKDNKDNKDNIFYCENGVVLFVEMLRATSLQIFQCCPMLSGLSFLKLDLRSYGNLLRRKILRLYNFYLKDRLWHWLTLGFVYDTVAHKFHVCKVSGNVLHYFHIIICIAILVVKRFY